MILFGLYLLLELDPSLEYVWLNVKLLTSFGDSKNAVHTGTIPYQWPNLYGNLLPSN